MSNYSYFYYYSLLKIENQMKAFSKTLLILLCQWFSLETLAQVVPYQPGAYYPGLANLRDFAADAPGFYIFNYSYFASSNGYFDRNGDEFTPTVVDGIPFDVPNPEVSGYINVPSVVYLSNFKLLGGNYQAMIQATYMHLDFDAVLVVGEPQPPLSGSVSGLGDLAVTPLGIAWSFNNTFDISFLYTAVMPTGRYDTEAEDNIGQGYWTHQFQAPAYVYFNDKATAIGIIPTLELNGRVTDVDAQIGNRFSLEYGVGQYVTEWLELELVGSSSWQISDDTGEAIWWQGTPFYSRDQRHSVAAGIGVWPGVDWLNTRIRYTTDYAARQSFKVNIFSFSFLFLPGQLKK